MAEDIGHEAPPRDRRAVIHRQHPTLRPTLVFLAYLAGYMALDATTEGLKGTLSFSSLWFPPVGLTFALLLIFGTRYVPAVALVYFLHLILFRDGLSYPVALLLAIPVCYTVLYAGAAVLLVRVVKIDPRLTRMRDVAWFVGVTCFLAPLLVSAEVVSGSILTGYVSFSGFSSNLLGFWAGDATGIGVLTSFLLVASRPFSSLWASYGTTAAGFRLPSRRELPEVGLQVLALALSLAVAYGSARGASLDFAYLAFTPLVWVALRGGFERATVVVLLINIGVVVLVGGGAGGANPLPLQFGLMALTLVGLLLGGQTTERMRAEEDLKKSERRFRSVVHNSSEAVTILDPDGTLRYASPAFERLFGYEPEEIVGKNVNDYIHPEDLPYVTRGAQKALAEPGVARNVAEHRLRHKDGSWRYLETIGTYLLDDPAVRGVVVNARDISERKKAERALRESEERYRAVVEQSTDGIFLFDGHTKHILGTNPSLQRMFGYTADELRGMKVYELIAHERGEVDAAVRRTLEEGRRYVGERKYRRKDGTLVDVEVGVSPISYEDEEVICVIVRDITGRKRAEEELKESEERYRAVVEQSAESIWLFDQKTKRVLESNASFQEMLGYTAEELRGMTNHDFVAHSREDVDATVRRKVQGRNLPEERKYRRKDGTLLDVEVNGTEISYRGKKVVCSVARDLTERRRVEEALRESEERFRSAFENAPVGVALVNLDGCRLRVNQALCEMLGYSEEDLLGKNYLENIHPEDREVSADRFHQTLEGETESYTLERRYVHADGHTVWDLSSVSLIRDLQGNPSHFVCLHQDITERKVLEERLEHQAFHDPLTDLPNRTLFMDRLGHALARTERRGEKVAVLFVDLDDFKHVNDSLGHETGDQLLVEVARRLKACLRPEDTAARLGGDEFTVLLEGIEQADGATRVAERIMEELRAPFTLDEHELLVSTSIGIALGGPRQNRLGDLLRDADAAMYRAKEGGKARYAVS